MGQRLKVKVNARKPSVQGFMVTARRSQGSRVKWLRFDVEGSSIECFKAKARRSRVKARGSKVIRHGHVQG